MQSSDAATTIVQHGSTPVSADALIGTKQDLAKQLSTSTNTSDGGIISQLTSNPFFTAGFGLAGLGALAAFGQRGVRRAAGLVRQRLLVDVEISIKDESYGWFLLWMTQHEKRQLMLRTAQGTPKATASTLSLGQRMLQRLTPRMRHLAVETSKLELPNGAITTHTTLIPGPGQHFIHYNGTIIHVNRQREANRTEMLQGGSRPFETTTLTTLYRDRFVFESIFREANQLAVEAVEGKTVIYTARGVTWEKFGHPRQKRPLDSVILEKGVKERIVADIQDFIASHKWYADRGVPYRRGYLLYGPPGTGKSSFIQALAGYLDYGIAIINLSERGLTDDRLNHLLTIIPQRTLVLLEDVDAAYNNRRQKIDSDGYAGANVTFSGLLNALDGVASAEERMLFLTTNHIERLDEALVRPGRVDMTVRLGNATAYQISALWDRFYGDIDADEATKQEKKSLFMTRLVKYGALANLEDHTPSSTSTAALQGLFLYNKGNPDGAIDMVWQLSPGEMPNAPLAEPKIQTNSS
ncbi:Complex III assembly protein translocase and chaperone [Lithohypha guttulata]|uniref:Complex III assembly protein translocase and chaperone n=1 Tax=Lithohypha guttulata TaxID=1690604 RepID=A0AAN7SYH4_9EURO|nr:Complex III assembly protein translocase and chaperone [Lithohypha guttulata]KAK5084580.1 Complex III assembly protein translocase and chaperone [Lithohypha guttulata]KAK5097902.1 Complex III assembly protein translocase and chaperone [Lithohypha guttulata]